MSNAKAYFGGIPTEGEDKMNWLQILLHPKRAEKYIRTARERVKKLEYYLYQDREWELSIERGIYEH